MAEILYMLHGTFWVIEVKVQQLYAAALISLRL
jgi:hypothetical protein